jgi:hypothetical protein
MEWNTMLRRYNKVPTVEGFQWEHFVQREAFPTWQNGDQAWTWPAWGEAARPIHPKDASRSVHWKVHRVRESGVATECVGFHEYRIYRRARGRRAPGERVLPEDVGKTYADLHADGSITQYTLNADSTYPDNHKPSCAQFLQQLRTWVKYIHGADVPPNEIAFRQQFLYEKAVEVILTGMPRPAEGSGIPDWWPKDDAGRDKPIFQADGTIQPELRTHLEKVKIEKLPPATGGHSPLE